MKSLIKTFLTISLISIHFNQDESWALTVLKSLESIGIPKTLIEIKEDHRPCKKTLESRVLLQICKREGEIHYPIIKRRKLHYSFSTILRKNSHGEQDELF